ncbi:MAG: hypothetical protein ACREPM_14380 [Gemmatimonadaceae bacterium]
MISTADIAKWMHPWNHLFAHSKVVSGSVTGAHIIALMFAGGLAIAADRSTLRAHTRDHATRAHQVRELQAVHAPVLAGLGVLLVSGILLALADVETFLPSPVFWLKLTLVTLLATNGLAVTLTERRLNAVTSDDGATSVEEALWSRMRRLAWTSATLWTATAVVGIVLSNIS